MSDQAATSSFSQAAPCKAAWLNGFGFREKDCVASVDGLNAYRWHFVLQDAG
jgi:hypothetical protein